MKGRGRELTRFATEPSASYGWNISPEGARIAIVKQPEARIHILSFDGQVPREIAVKGWDNFTNTVWAEDGKGLFVSSTTKGGPTLLHVDLQGNAHVLWQSKGETGSGIPLYGVPSPDGRHLAIHSSTLNSNMWTIESF